MRFPYPRATKQGACYTAKRRATLLRSHARRYSYSDYVTQAFIRELLSQQSNRIELLRWPYPGKLPHSTFTPFAALLGECMFLILYKKEGGGLKITRNYHPIQVLRTMGATKPNGTSWVVGQPVLYMTSNVREREDDRKRWRGPDKPRMHLTTD